MINLKNTFSPSYFLVLLGLFFSTSFAFVFSLMSLLLISAAGFSEAESLSLVAGAHLISGIAQLIIGRHLDSKRAVLLLGIATLFSATGPIGILYIKEPLTLTFVLALYLIGSATLQTGATLFLEGLVKPELREKAASIGSTAVNLGFAISSLTAYFLIKEYKEILLTLDSFSNLVYGFILISVFLFYRKNLTDDEKQTKRTKDVTIKSIVKNTLLAKREIIGTLALYFSVCAQFSVIPIIYRHIGVYAEGYTAMMGFFNSFLVAIISSLLAKGVIKTDFKVNVFIAIAFSAVGHALTPFVTSIQTNFLVTCIWSIGEAFIYPVITVSIFSRYPNQLIGFASGLKVFLLRLSFVTAPLITKIFLYMDSHSFGILVGAIPCIAILLIPGKKHDSKGISH